MTDDFLYTVHGMFSRAIQQIWTMEFYSYKDKSFFWIACLFSVMTPASRVRALYVYTM
jgi:hypothetical protein